MTENDYQYKRKLEEGWPKTLQLTATYTKEFESQEEVEARIREVCNDRGIVLHYDPKLYDEPEAVSKKEFADNYPNVNWPPRTLEDFAKMTQHDLEDDDLKPWDEFDDDPTYETKAV